MLGFTNFGAEKNKKSWPGNREFIGTILATSGEIKVYMPSFGDVENLSRQQAKQNVENYDFATQLAALAINKSLEEFNDLAYQDAAAIVQLILDASVNLKPLVSTNRGGQDYQPGITSGIDYTGKLGDIDKAD